MKTPKFRNKKKHAFTLIEILVVVTIIALLVGVFVPLTSKALSNARINSAAADIRNLSNIAGDAASKLGGTLPLTEGITNMNQVSNGLLDGRLGGANNAARLSNLNALLGLDNVFMSMKNEDRRMDDYYRSPLGITIEKTRVRPPVRYDVATGEYKVDILPAGNYTKTDGFGDSSRIECANVTAAEFNLATTVNTAGGINFRLDGVNLLPAGRCAFLILEGVPLTVAYDLARKLNSPSLMNGRAFNNQNQTLGPVIYRGNAVTTTVYVYLANF
ncbi:MAG: prepilin-type N-terminal cleavage/methylation domain-containing protein [Opitutus sp.]|nr:prepilin-type N-terminal cleavage/methylation domain-containing protein [Opitutus sp.]MCS6246598.1 prepilin-type N-terminal cleavage/methylation domain-containing protein [Opitutus sp.]MCS6274589.1 prepilin-type N-terminal cleavage/methylation domain-containing protein [Opitutus sp.]MCS6276068.1 prepilin-type N-terminal cleavage/methylation domain-containing protein [Opitutus sp.]MCS6301164.1 prepilin-type N-terminal cleavage/methylation domain-containing protein [Opitutus sp.]